MDAPCPLKKHYNLYFSDLFYAVLAISFLALLFFVISSGPHRENFLKVVGCSQDKPTITEKPKIVLEEEKNKTEENKKYQEKKEESEEENKKEPEENKKPKKPKETRTKTNKNKNSDHTNKTLHEKAKAEIPKNLKKEVCWEKYLQNVRPKCYDALSWNKVEKYGFNYLDRKNCRQ